MGRRQKEQAARPEDVVAAGTPIAGKNSRSHPEFMTESEFLELGHRRNNPFKIMRSKCLECCGGYRAEVRHCPMLDCALWPYRMGTNPFRKTRSFTKLQKVALARGQKRNGGRKDG